jgi:hypothetical protein
MTKQRDRHVLCTSQEVAGWLFAALMLTMVVITGFGLAATAADAEEHKTAGGLTVYLGMLPAEMVKGPGLHSAERSCRGRPGMESGEGMAGTEPWRAVFLPVSSMKPSTLPAQWQCSGSASD